MIVTNLVPLRVNKDWNEMSKFFLKRKIRIDVDFVELDTERAQLTRHLLAEVAVCAPVKPRAQASLCRSARRP